MQIKLFSSTDTIRKKAPVIVAAAAAIVGIGTIIISMNLDHGSENKPLAAATTAAASADQNTPVTPTPADSAIVAGSIETKDGKDLSIWLAAGNDNNFAVMDRTQGETLTMRVESEQEGKLEVGIMSVSTDKIYSKSVPHGTGTVTITVPADGEYRVYIKNHSVEEAHFRLILDKQLTGPLV